MSDILEVLKQESIGCANDGNLAISHVLDQGVEEIANLRARIAELEAQLSEESGESQHWHDLYKKECEYRKVTEKEYARELDRLEAQQRAGVPEETISAGERDMEHDDYKAWYEEAIIASNEAGFAGMSAAQVIEYQDGEIMRLQTEVKGLMEALERAGVPEGIKVSEACIYKLNDRGYNEWFAQVQPGVKSDGTRLKQKECEHIALMLAGQAPTPKAQEQACLSDSPQSDKQPSLSVTGESQAPQPAEVGEIPNFEAVRDKRMSELSPAEQRDARELWIRDQLGWFDEYHAGHIKFLLERLDGARAQLTEGADAEPLAWLVRAEKAGIPRQTVVKLDKGEADDWVSHWRACGCEATVTPLAALTAAGGREELSPEAHLMAEANKYWRFANSKHYGAVQWIENHETGELLIFTRGEYRETLMRNITMVASQPAKEGETE